MDTVCLGIDSYAAIISDFAVYVQKMLSEMHAAEDWQGGALIPHFCTDTDGYQSRQRELIVG